MSGEDLLAEAEALGITEAEIEVLSGLQLTALMEKKRKEIAPEVLPPSRSRSRDWSLADPSALHRLVHAIIKAEGDYERGRLEAGCPEDIFWALIEDDNFELTYKRLAQKLIGLPLLPAAIRQAMTDGGAYGMAQVNNIAPKENLDENEQAKMRALRSGGKAAYVKTLTDLRDRADAMLKMLTGVQEPPHDLIDAYVREVTVSPKDFDPSG